MVFEPFPGFVRFAVVIEFSFLFHDTAHLIAHGAHLKMAGMIICRSSAFAFLLFQNGFCGRAGRLA
jgi:hypothetical protein